MHQKARYIYIYIDTYIYIYALHQSLWLVKLTVDLQNIQLFRISDPLTKWIPHWQYFLGSIG